MSSIRINPSVGGPDNNPNARLTVEQQVSNNVTLTYITNLTRSAQQVIQFEYNINSEYTSPGHPRRKWRGQFRPVDSEEEAIGTALPSYN